MTTSATRAAGLCALLATTCLVSPAIAQSSADQPTPPRSYNLDENGVDLVTGQYYLSMTDVSIGNADSGLSYSRRLRTAGYDDPYVTALNMVAGEYDVSIGAISDNFKGPNGDSTQGNGARLAAQPNGDFWYITKDGTRYVFSKSFFSTRFRVAQYRATQIVYPDGRSVRIEYDINSSPSYHLTRPSAVSSSDGYRLTFRYQADALPGSDAERFARWMTVASVTASNSAVEHCEPESCLPSDSRWRSATYTWSADKLQETRTDAAGRVMVTTIDAAGRITAVKPFGSTSDRIVLTYDDSGRVATFTTAGGTWRYDRSAGPLKVISPTGLTRIVTANAAGKILTDQLGTGGKRAYEYDDKKRMTKIVLPEGNAVVYRYDTRDNAISATTIAKDGATAFSTSASFSATCDNVLTCNKPTSVTDARGNTTDYAYDPAHGGVTRITRPNAGGQPSRPETRFTYSSLRASYYGANGSILQGSPIWKLATISKCAAGGATNDATTCVGTANETRTEIGYAAPGPGNNLLPTGMTIRAGDSSVSTSQSMTYNKQGDVAAVDGPLSGSGDTTLYGYDAAGALAEVRSPDSDGGGGLGSRVTKFVRDTEGRVTDVQAGYYPNGQNTFVVSQTLKSSYDPTTGLKVADTLLESGTVVELTQYKYDGDQRPLCTAFRLNRAEAADACVNAGGSSGSDVIEQLSYGPDGRVMSAHKGGSQIAAYTYTPNGQIATVSDGEGNRTTYDYDGLDRAYRARYPLKTQGANASVTVNPDGSGDYEQLGYDANGNVLSRRLRDGQVLSYSYDALNRRTRDDNPNTNVAEVDVDYSYDHLDRLKSASDQNGWHNSFDYDALGRATRQYSNLSSNALQYDAAGRMTRQTWSDGFFVTYEYDQAGAMTLIRERGVLELARFGYDDLGRRRTLTRGNGTVTTYDYDPGSRLSSLVQVRADGTPELKLDIGYDGLGRINSRISSNDAYAFTGATNVSNGYTANGLNQYIQAGTVTPTYDARGNVTSAGGQSYAYNTRNQLAANGAGQLFYRNPMGLFAQGDGTNSDYVGDELATEFSGNIVARRYVYGPGVDEPLVWYEGAGTGDRRYLHADERGSVIAATNDAGAAIVVNTYDDYGRPGSNNQGRFQYTGQRWIAPLGLYDYKARMYSPQLGRFMQTDPIGYADGMNMYAYVGGDPVNKVDPSGLDGEEIVVTAPRLRQGVGISLGSLPDQLSAPGSSNGFDKLSGLMEWGPLLTLAGYEPYGPPGLKNPYVNVRLNWPFFNHVARRHFGNDARASIFRPENRNPVALTKMVSFAVANAIPQTGRYPNTYTYTTQYPTWVGWERGTGRLTDQFTVIVLDTFKLDQLGKRVFETITAYPGVP